MGDREAKDESDQGETKQQLHVSKDVRRTRQLLTRPLRLTGVRCVSSAQPTSGLDMLRSHIVESARNAELFPTLRIILPQTWMRFEQQLRDLRDKATEEYQSAESTSHNDPIVLRVQRNKFKWLALKECLQHSQFAGLTADRLEPVLSYLQRVGTILRYTDIPELKDLVFHDPSGLIQVIKELFHHDLEEVFTTRNPRLQRFSETKLRNIRQNLSSQGFLPREVIIALLGPHAIPARSVDVIINLMEHFGLCYTEWSDELEGGNPTPIGYCIPWYIRMKRSEATNQDVAEQEKKEFTVTCEIAHFCPRGLFERLSVVVNKFIKSRQDWKDVVMAVRKKLPIIVYRETKDENVSIVIKLTIPAQMAQVIGDAWDVIGPLEHKLLKLLLEWPGLLYQLVYAESPRQSEHPEDQQTSTLPSVIPIFEVGPQGTTVHHGGVSLEFPKRCVCETRFISVEVEALPVNDDVRTNFTAVSAVLTVEQDFPRRFLRPVTVRLPWVWTKPAVGKETITMVLHYSRDEGWTVFQTDTHAKDHRIMFETDRFQSFWVLEVLQNCSIDFISWVRETWNDYIMGKVYVIVTPKVNTLPERTLHLICLSKADDMRDFFESTDVTFDSQIKQRVALKQYQRLEASFGKDEDVDPDPRDLRQDDPIILCPPTRRSVRLRIKDSVSQKRVYEGKVNFTIRTPMLVRTETEEGQSFQVFVQLHQTENDSTQIQDAQPFDKSKEPCVFICHAGEDKDRFVRPLFSELESLGLKGLVFLDEVSLQPGDHIKTILYHLKSPAMKLVVFVVSRHVLNDKYWPTLEYVTAVQAGKRVFPIWLDESVHAEEFAARVREYSDKVLQTMEDMAHRQKLKSLVAKRISVGDIEDNIHTVAREIVGQVASL
ncbi:uncharacterized protein [Branchiostoma lanceolatum]|uniref:uncharacterized protein n=1 Tax=Branchiostoma lanceolatum TaxID=7740 RepID=UPI0034568197